MYTRDNLSLLCLHRKHKTASAPPFCASSQRNYFLRTQRLVLRQIATFVFVAGGRVRRAIAATVGTASLAVPNRANRALGGLACNG